MWNFMASWKIIVNGQVKQDYGSIINQLVSLIDITTFKIKKHQPRSALGMVMPLDLRRDRRHVALVNTATGNHLQENTFVHRLTGYQIYGAIHAEKNDNWDNMFLDHPSYRWIPDRRKHSLRNSHLTNQSPVSMPEHLLATVLLQSAPKLFEHLR